MTGTEVSKAFSQRLSALIEEKRKSGLGIREIANKVGISTGALSKYQNDAAAPDINALWKISQFFNVSTDYLLGLSDFRNPQLQLEEAFNQDVANRENIQTYRAIQAHIAAIVDDIWGNNLKQSQALQSLTDFINTLSDIKRFAYVTGKSEKPDFIKALGGATYNTAIYIRAGRLKFDADEFRACEKALYAFLARYYEILWETEHLHPDPLLSNTQSSASDVKEGKTHGNR